MMGGKTSWQEWDEISYDLHGGGPWSTVYAFWNKCIAVYTVVTVFSIWCSDILEPRWHWRDCPAEGWLMSRDSKQFACELAFQVHQLIQSLLAPTTSFIELLLSEAISPRHNARTRYQKTRDNHYVPEPTEILQTRQLQTYLRCLSYFPGKWQKMSLPIFPPPLCLLTNPGVSLALCVGGLVPPVSRDLWVCVCYFPITSKIWLPKSGKMGKATLLPTATVGSCDGWFYVSAWLECSAQICGQTLFWMFLRGVLGWD